LGVVNAAEGALAAAVALSVLGAGALGFASSAAIKAPEVTLNAKLHAKIVLNTVTALWADW
jgi:hypothetical protein